MENICKTIEQLDGFFTQFGLSVRTLNANTRIKYLRGTVDLTRSNIVPPSVQIERAFERFKSQTELHSYTMTFAGLQFIIK
jgi:hypothetical protein